MKLELSDEQAAVLVEAYTKHLKIGLPKLRRIYEK